MGDSDLRIPPCQQILEEQGYLVVGGRTPRAVGDVIGEISGGLDYDMVPGPLVIVGYSTMEEWQAQSERYAGVKTAYRGYSYFFKVIAE